MLILYQYASRSRPERFFTGLDNILSLQQDKENFRIQCVLDEDDATVDYAFLDRAQRYAEQNEGKIIWNFGHSTGKIHAINRQLPELPWDILINFSDDMKFIRPAFDEIIRSAFEIHGLNTFMHFPDQDTKDILCTMSIMGRPYYERDRYIYHPAYKSLWADNHAMAVAKLRGCYQFDPCRLYDHLLPAMGHLPRDPLFEYEQGFWPEDERTFRAFELRNFDL